MHTHLSYMDYFSDFFLNGIKDNIVKQIEKKSNIKINSSIVSRLMRATLNDPDCQKLLEQMDKARMPSTAATYVPSCPMSPGSKALVLTSMTT